MANLLLMYSIISILLTCFGLFGMALYATKQRTKEIGIRKVNGASTRSIMLLLIRQFVKWIAVAFVIATPLAWVLLNQPDKHFPTLFPNGRRHRPGHHITNGRMAQLPGSFEQPGKKPKE